MTRMRTRTRTRLSSSSLSSLSTSSSSSSVAVVVVARDGRNKPSSRTSPRRAGVIPSASLRRPVPSVSSSRPRARLVKAFSRTEEDDDIVEFGYSRKDVIFLCMVPLVGGYATYYGLQKFGGLNPIEAGNYVQVIFVFLLCVAWCGSYLFRVGTKNMTYTQQLKDYEEAVMQKRLQEMSDSEIKEILDSGKSAEEIYREDKGG